MWNLENDTVNLFAKQKQRQTENGHMDGGGRWEAEGQEERRWDELRDWG